MLTRSYISVIIYTERNKEDITMMKELKKLFKKGYKFSIGNAYGRKECEEWEWEDIKEELYDEWHEGWKYDIEVLEDEKKVSIYINLWG